MEPLPLPEFDKLIHAKIVLIAPETVDKIALVMKSAGMPPLPDWWNYDWTVSKDEKHGYTGTMSKRIKKWLFVEHGHKAEDKVVSDLGERIRAWLPTTTNWIIDFTRNFNWSPGNFHESDTSCWWNANNDAREALANADGFAMRMYYPDTEDPMGRCWVAALSDHYTLFNAYGRYYLHSFAHVMAAHLGLSFKTDISIQNCRRPTGLVYINSSLGAVVGPKAVVQGISSDDLKIDVSEHSKMCSYCGMDLWGIETYDDGCGGWRCKTCHLNKATVPIWEAAQV